MTKSKPKTATPPAPEPNANRYTRVARIMIAEADGIDLTELAALAGVSLKGATRCREAYRGVVEALREAGMLKGKAPAKKPSAPSTVEPETEPEPAVA